MSSTMWEKNPCPYGCVPGTRNSPSPTTHRSNWKEGPNTQSTFHGSRKDLWKWRAQPLAVRIHQSPTSSNSYDTGILPLRQHAFAKRDRTSRYRIKSTRTMRPSEIVSWHLFLQILHPDLALRKKAEQPSCNFFAWKAKRQTWSVLDLTVERSGKKW